METNDSEFVSVIAQDFAAAKRAFETAAYDLMNIYSNRIMANAVLLESKESIIPGVILKEVALDCLAVKKSDKSLKPMRSAARILIDALAGNLDMGHSGDENDWKAYCAYIDATRQSKMEEIEAQVYQENKAYATSVAGTLMGWLSDNRDLLIDPRNLFLKGILNEFSRVIRVHGSDEKATILFVLLKILDRYYSYVAYSAALPDGTMDGNAIEDAMRPSIDSITKYVNSSSPEEFFDQATKIAVDLVSEWRKLFVFYMEPVLIPLEAGKRIELPSEVKNRLSEIITQALKKEVEKP